MYIETIIKFLHDDEEHLKNSFCTARNILKGPPFSEQATSCNSFTTER